MHTAGEPPPWAAPDDGGSPSRAEQERNPDRPAPAPAVHHGFVASPYAPPPSAPSPRRGRGRREAVLAALGCVVALGIVVTQLGGALGTPAAPSSGSSAPVAATPGGYTGGRRPLPTTAGTPGPTPATGPRVPAVRWPLPDRCFEKVSTPSDDADATDLVARYRVQQGVLVTLVKGEADECHRRVWSVVAAVLPPGQLRLIDEFTVYQPDEEGGTDTVGYVKPHDGTLISWELGISLVGLSDQDLADVVTHELGHLLTLNGYQVDAGSDGEDCRTYSTAGRCTRAGSLLDSYVSRTWTRSMLAQYGKLDALDDGPGYERTLSTFHDRNRDRFVSRYAATSPEEDFAETFSAWCLAGAPTAPRLSTPALVAKGRFLSSRPELTGVRARCALMR